METISPIKAVIWDVGGVLIRTEDQQPREHLAKRYNLTRAELNALVFDSEEAIRASLGEIPERALWGMVAKTLHIPAAELVEFERQFWAGDYFDKELHDFIRKLRPRYKTGLLSNAWSDARMETDERFHLLDVFDVIVYSAEVHLAKPAPEIYELALKQLGVEPQEAIFVDDFQANIEAADALGIHGVRFVNSQQAQQDVAKILSSDGYQ